jgi:hypothetical protein
VADPLIILNRVGVDTGFPSPTLSNFFIVECLRIILTTGKNGKGKNWEGIKDIKDISSTYLRYVDDCNTQF